MALPASLLTLALGDTARTAPGDAGVGVAALVSRVMRITRALMASVTTLGQQLGSVRSGLGRFWVSEGFEHSISTTFC